MMGIDSVNHLSPKIAKNNFSDAANSQRGRYCDS